MKFTKLPVVDQRIKEGNFPVWETARYRCVTGVVVKGEQNVMNQSHNVMWFHDRDGFSKPYKTRHDAAVAGRGLYDC